MQMQMQLLTGTSSSILNKPDQLLSFIKQVLESTSISGLEVDAGPSKPRRDALQMLPTPEEEEDADSDDDDPESEVIRPDDELLETTLNLLLAVMECRHTTSVVWAYLTKSILAREDLSVRTAPLLNDIFELLEPIALSGSSSLGPLAREARMVVTARSASTSVENEKPSGDKEDAQEKYQKALKLLQDPILPVRAHGLLLLRELVTTDSKSMNSALRPAVLSIFLQSIQDEDSYIFLNGVQGLAAMVDVFGQDVLSSLLREYSDGLERNGTFMSEQELSVRVRVGEALGIVIRRCGTSLGRYRE
jgi:Required for nuclear transport of RNA pol II C-terminus 1